jgi:hypothetical protein
MSTYASFFLDSGADEFQYELLEISHPDFTQTYYIVRNAKNGLTVTHEDSTSHDYDYYPVAIKQAGTNDDLDQKLSITFGDLGQILPTELDAIFSADSLGIKPILKYRTYRSTDLSVPLFGPLRFELSNLSFTDEGVSFDATAPKLNQLATGELYTMKRFPMLKGFL